MIRWNWSDPRFIALCNSPLLSMSSAFRFARSIASFLRPARPAKRLIASAFTLICTLIGAAAGTGFAMPPNRRVEVMGDPTVDALRDDAREKAALLLRRVEKDPLEAASRP